jgi:hypothetical protein
MSGALQAVFQNHRSFALAIGDAYEGGFFAGQISYAGNGIADYNLVVGPRSSALTNLAWKNAQTATTGADSVVNGTQNTADMVADGNSTVYPAAHFCNDLVTGGKTDWYMPAKNELEICYYNLKPNTTLNSTVGGANTNAVPSRPSNYTSGNPARTTATAFINPASESFPTSNTYWTSTEVNAADARGANFDNGQQYADYKTTARTVRAIRRVAL